MNVCMYHFQVDKAMKTVRPEGSGKSLFEGLVLPQQNLQFAITHTLECGQGTPLFWLFGLSQASRIFFRYACSMCNLCDPVCFLCTWTFASVERNFGDELFVCVSA